MKVETWPLGDGGSGADLMVLVPQDSENHRTLPPHPCPQPTTVVKGCVPLMTQIPLQCRLGELKAAEIIYCSSQPSPDSPELQTEADHGHGPRQAVLVNAHVAAQKYLWKAQDLFL